MGHIVVQQENFSAVPQTWFLASFRNQAVHTFARPSTLVTLATKFAPELRFGLFSSWCRYSVPSTLPGWLGEDTREMGECLFWIQPLTSNVPFSKANERFFMISGAK